MQTWEYRTIYINTEVAFSKSEEEVWDSGAPESPVKFGKGVRHLVTWERTTWLTEYLNELGREGWELAVGYGLRTGTPFLPQFLVLKRPGAG